MAKRKENEVDIQLCWADRGGGEGGGSNLNNSIKECFVTLFFDTSCIY
jgi:hypothetical protein